MAKSQPPLIPAFFGLNTPKIDKFNATIPRWYLLDFATMFKPPQYQYGCIILYNMFNINSYLMQAYGYNLQSNSHQLIVL